MCVLIVCVVLVGWKCKFVSLLLSLFAFACVLAGVVAVIGNAFVFVVDVVAVVLVLVTAVFVVASAIALLFLLLLCCLLLCC